MEPICARPHPSSNYKTTGAALPLLWFSVGAPIKKVRSYSRSASSRIRRSVFSQPRQAAVMLLP